MKCKSCGSTNISTQVVNEVTIKDKHKGFLWWLFVGFWWVPIKWILFTLPALILFFFGRKKTKAVNKTVVKAVCQNCGNAWTV